MCVCVCLSTLVQASLSSVPKQRYRFSRPNLALSRVYTSMHVGRAHLLPTHVYIFRASGAAFTSVLCIFLHAGHLDQWNLKTLKPCHSLDCQGGPVWCIVNNPVSPHTLAVGSDDGMVCSHYTLYQHYCYS